MGDVIEILTTATNTVEVEAAGPQGIPGVGVPTGGSALQVLRKKTSTDYDTEWAAAGSGSGSVTSVALASTDLTISGSPITDSGTITANIAANAVTLEKLQTISSEHLLGRHGSGNGGVQQVGLGTGLAISGSNVGVTFGSSAGTACEGNDARLSDSRTPTAHAASHQVNGSDAIPCVTQALQLADNANPDPNDTLAFGLQFNSNATPSWVVGEPTDLRDAISAADVSHAHGNITNDGKLGSTAGLPVVTTTAGAVTTLALGTANQILRVNSGATAVEFADPAASGVTGAAASASDVLGVSGANITGVDATADRIVFWDDSANKLTYLEAGSGLSISGTTLTATATGTIGGGTGSVDNAILRADGTGGSTSQSSDINIEDATTSTANNVTISNQHSGQTNSSLVLQPKGTGAFILGEKPAATSSSGNARGASAVDLQLIRTNAARVASGLRSALLGGANNTASGQDAVVIGGNDNTASGFQSIVLGGRNNTANADRAVAIADGNTSSGTNSIAMGSSNTASAAQSLAICHQSRADRLNIFAHGSGAFSTAGDAQRIRAVLRCKTTTNAAVEMALDGSTTYLTIPSGKVIFCNIKVVGVKSDGAVVATYERQYAAKNVAGTSSEVFAPVTIGTDNASSTSLEVATVDAGDYIRIRPTGITSETWRWVASVDAVEVAYGS